MAKDYVPGKESKMEIWLKTVKEAIANRGSGLDLSPAEIAQAGQFCDEYVEQIDEARKARIKAKSEVAKKKAMRKTHLQPLRKLIKRMKVSASYTTGAGAGMNALSHKYELDQQSFLPVLKPRATGGLIEIKFKKRGIQGMEFWVQINNGEWQKLGRRNHSPFSYKPEGYAQGTALNCKFKSVAIIKDEYFGQWSEIITVLYEVVS